MKFKTTAVSVALLIANGVSAQDLPYYSIEEISVNANDASYGPYPTAISEDASIIVTHSMKASLSSNVDIGLPYTFNRYCQYDDIICELVFSGSETAGDLSYENAYKAWRNAQSNAVTNGYTSYMMANVLSDCSVVEVPYSTTATALSCASDEAQKPYDSLDNESTDVKVTGLYQEDANSDLFIIGYSSGAYSLDSSSSTYTREFVRRAFIKNINGDAIQLLPSFGEGSDENGGFSSAYKIQKVDDKVLVVGHSSVSYADDNSDYFDDCYNSTEEDDVDTLNELTHCPGYNTQAWVWDVTDVVENGSTVVEVSGSALATEWLEGETTPSDNSTFSAHAEDINTSGIAVGASTFEYDNDVEGARERAIIMTPTNSVYSAPEELTAAVDDISDDEDNIYNTWAVTVSEEGIVTGNREYQAAKSRNKATEFFVYDNTSKTIDFPLLDKKVATAEERLESGSHYTSKSGANSRIYAANESGFMVGEVDDYDQVQPEYDGSPRSQAAFLFNSNTDEAWFMNDLICNQDATTGVVDSPYIRIITARIINDDGVVLADGYIYPTADDYKDKNNGVQAAFKLTPNAAVSSPNESPNCWESDLLKTVVEEESYSRSGGATFWLWLFALPVVFIRRFKR